MSTQTQEDTTVFELLEIEMNFDKEVPCDVKDRVHSCGKVTHRLTWCTNPSYNICTDAVNLIQVRMIGVNCAECKRPAKDCWRIFPI